MWYATVSYQAQQVIDNKTVVQCVIKAFELLPHVEPVYQAGELEDGGSDLELRGSIPYYAVEVIYVTALLQVLSALITDKVWWLLLAVSLTYGADENN